MPFSIIFAFLPWIIFDLLPKYSHTQIVFAMVLALIVTIASNYKYLKKFFVLPCATLLFFAISLVAVIFFNLRWLPTHVGVATNLICALIIWSSLLIRQPFTIQYAKEYVPQGHWTHPVFIFINNVLTSVWGIIFIFNFLINLFNTKINGIYPALGTLLTNGTTLFGVWFCTWFPNWYPQYLNGDNT